MELVRDSTNQDVQSFLLSAYQQLQLNYPKFYKMDHISKLGWLAAEVLLKEEQLQDVRAEDMAIVLQNAHASLDTDVKYYETVSDIASPALFVYTLPNIVIGEISIRHKFKGENAFFVANTFDATLTAQYVGSLLDRKSATHCICGWVDVLDESYKAVLFLVANSDKGIAFTADNMRTIFNGEN
ncbi:MAG: hypothetical protein J0I41_22610 [Filimonas sp.]|nr:hypothetical protein [Filimonas sp.]